MQCNRQFNKSSMVAIGVNYKRKVPTVGTMHTGRLFTPNKRQKVRGLLRGNGDAVMSQQCRLCKRKCITISDFGFVAHAKCVRKHECDLRVNAVYGIYPNVASQFPTLKTRMCEKGPCKTYFCIKDGIEGVFPGEHSLSGFFAGNVAAVIGAQAVESRRLRSMYQSSE